MTETREQRAKRHRGRAQKLRAVAEKATNPTIKKQMLIIAAQYERLAAQALDPDQGGRKPQIRTLLYRKRDAVAATALAGGGIRRSPEIQATVDALSGVPVERPANAAPWGRLDEPVRRCRCHCRGRRFVDRRFGPTA
jgi:hypothetical protein